MPKWTAEDIPSLTGKIAVVTGANSGLGLETTRALARKGATVVLACRSADKAEAAIAELEGDGIDREQLAFVPLDLASLDSIRQFSEAVAERHDHLDLLINNAGVMALPYRRTSDGFEMQFGTNHLGHFALTGRLLPLLDAAESARVVSVASLAHKMGKIRFQDLQWEQRYHKWLAYGQSKLANLLFAFELQRKLEAADKTVRSVAAHPGYSSTNLIPDEDSLRSRIMIGATRKVAQSAAMGALPQLYAATADDVQGFDYYGPDGRFEMVGYPTRVNAMPKAHDRQVADRLWRVSSELVGVDYANLS